MIYTKTQLSKELKRSFKWLDKWMSLGFIPSQSYTDEFGRKFYTEDDKIAIEKFSKEKKQRTLLPTQWSRDYSECVNCHSTEYPHQANGLCKSCYNKKYLHNGYLKRYRQEHKAHLQDIKKQWYEEHRQAQLDKGKLRREQNHFSSNRELVLERDEYKCQICGNDDKKKLVVHHKDGTGRGADVHNNSLDNLITLCRSCHARVHGQQHCNFHP